MKTAVRIFFVVAFVVVANDVYAGAITDAPPLRDLLLRVLLFLLSVVGFIGIISAIVLGCMFLFSSGSPQLAERAKKGVVWSIVGVVVALGALVLFGFLGSFF